MSVVDEVKERLDLAEVVGETVDLRKSGKNYTGFCPFHPNTRTPAFVVFPDTQTWRCFGACNEGGDIFQFVMKKEGWDFSEALARLAERAGVELRPRTPEQEEAEEARDRIRELLETAATFYRHQLLKTDQGQEINDYLQSRGLSKSSIEDFGLGYAPDAWESTLAHLRERGYAVEDILESGMVSERDSGGYYDRFRHRIMIPIRDPGGRMAGFGARIINPQDVPKFLNSPQTPIFDKSRLLYGLDKARKPIRSNDQAVIVEGYFDVIALHQAGYQNAVSPMGTALTESQLRLLKRYSRNIVLALDADAAGDQGTLRGLSLAREAMDREYEPVFNARGLIRYEGRLDAEIRVISLPQGLDPDDVVVEEPERWENMLSKALPVVDHVLETLSAGQDLEDPKVKAEIARQVLPLIEDVADPVERQSYRQHLARKLKVDERAVMTWQPSRSRSGSRRAKTQGEGEEKAVTGRTVPAVERFCLAVLLTDPEIIYRVDRQLHTMELERLSARDFTDVEGQTMYQALRKALEQDEMDPVAYWRENLPEPLQEQAKALLQEVGSLNFDLPRVMEEILANFLRLRKRNIENNLSQLQFRLQSMEEMEAEGSLESEEFQRILRDVQRSAGQRERLDRALGTRAGLIQGSMVSEEW